MNSAIIKPRFVSIPLADGLRWTGGGDWVYQEKKDGVWALREWRGATLAGEQMRNGDFWAFDVLKIQGDDCRRFQLRDRLRELVCMSSDFDGGMRLIPSGSGGEFLEAVLSRGGEGVVAKRLDQPYGATWTKCKRLETFRCVVVEKDLSGKRSVRVAALETGKELGSCGLFGEKFEAVRVGSVLKIEAFGLTPAGRMREPRPCKDSPGSWLVSY